MEIAADAIKRAYQAKVRSKQHNLHRCNLSFDLLVITRLVGSGKDRSVQMEYITTFLFLNQKMHLVPKLIQQELLFPLVTCE